MRHFALALLLFVDFVAQVAIRAQTPEPVTDRHAWFADLRRAVRVAEHGSFQQALDSYRDLFSTVPITTSAEVRAYVLSRIADCEIELGDYKQAEASAREALGMLASAEDTSAFAQTEGILAQVLRGQGNYTEAKARAEHAIAVAKRTMMPSDPGGAILLVTLAQVLQETGNDLRRAGVLCREAIQIFEENGAGSRMNLASAYENLAVVYSGQGKLRQALDTLDLALRAWNEELPPKHPFLVDALAAKVVIYVKLRDFKRAEQMIPEMLEASVSRFGANNPERAILLNNAAGVYIVQKRYSEAEPLLREGVEIYRRNFSLGHPALNNLLRNYSYVLDKLNRKEEASLARAQSQVVSAFQQQSKGDASLSKP